MILTQISNFNQNAYTMYIVVMVVCFSWETGLKKILVVSESYCKLAVVLFIYVSYTNKMCLN